MTPDRIDQLLIDSISDYSIAMLDTQGRVLRWNTGAEQLKGYTREEMLGKHYARIFTPEDRAAGAPERALEAARRSGHYVTEGWRVRKDGRRIRVIASMDQVLMDGELVGFTKVACDVSFRQSEVETLAELGRRLGAAVSQMRRPVTVFDASERLLLANDAFCQTFSLSEWALWPGMHVRDLLGELGRQLNHADDPDWVERIYRAHRELIAAARAQGDTIERAIDLGAGRRIARTVLPDGSWISMYEGVAEQKRMEAHMEYMLRHDVLTGLPNRLAHAERLEREMSRAQEQGTGLAVIIIDIDRFQEINDLHGHSVGDRLLTVYAERLAGGDGEARGAARIGADEFAVTCRYAGEEALQCELDRLREIFARPIRMLEMELAPRVSIGLACAPEHGATPDQLFNNAELAMRRAKEPGAPLLCRFDPQMDEASRARRALARDLREAIRRGQIDLAFQVQACVQSGVAVGFEALARWTHPVLGRIPPGDFVALAEGTGEIDRLGELVLRRACCQAALWPGRQRVAVNLSPLQFASGRLPALVSEVLRDSGLPAARLELEITESALIEERRAAIAQMEAISRMGITFVLDDFGKGFSSFGTLRSFVFGKLKIDRSFIAGVGESAPARAVLRAMVALGHSLGLNVLAEGVETESELAVIRAEGCDEMQGYLIGRPVLPGAPGAPDNIS
ncbi:sensor domain-containing protein [Paroceanicella profunda]|uniref:sensor domain-containing protein n=1 Tax=Paroceanicella profunda TaxID=2579971 RepID=UPI0014781C27|nr:EAL domain-containing protein [Paroceanicella profunda]